MTVLADRIDQLASRRRAEGLVATDVAVIVGAFLLSRLLLTAFGMLTLATHTSGFVPVLPDLFVRWDSAWYVSLAEHGYSMVGSPRQPDETNYAFYPLYPALIWLLSHATGVSAAAAGVVISNLAFLAALFVIFALAEDWSGDKAIARLGVMLICCVPESFIFSAVYTESLFLLLTSASMLLFERKHYVAAGFCAGLSSAVRSNGVLVIMYFGLSLLRSHGLRNSLAFWKEPERYLPIVMAPLGLFAFWWMCMLTTGDAFAQASTAMHGWHWRSDWPWLNIMNRLVSGEDREKFFVIASGFMFAGSLTLVRRSSWPLFAYCAINFLLFWSGTQSNSLLRYSVVLFPIYFGIARVLAHRPLMAGIVLAASLFVDLLMMALWALGSDLVL
jgi:hypothetical protein